MLSQFGFDTVNPYLHITVSEGGWRKEGGREEEKEKKRSGGGGGEGR